MSNTFHILNGDALLDFFPAILPGDIIVARECLVDGPTNGETLDEFWRTRAAFIYAEFGEAEDSYFLEVATEFEKITAIQAGSEVNLWFEEDLFCQVNLWFCVSLLLPISRQLSIYIVKPPLQAGKPDWAGFGSLRQTGLADAYGQRTLLSHEEIILLGGLWNAYKNGNNKLLEKLGKFETKNFPFLNEVIQAQLDRRSEDGLSGRPENVLRNIIQEKNTTDFKVIFAEFGKREGIYGFGDFQVESLLQKIST